MTKAQKKLTFDEWLNTEGQKFSVIPGSNKYNIYKTIWDAAQKNKKGATGGKKS